MAEISPEAQALIDRLALMDPANPRQDKPAIERAITMHLAALGLQVRPFVWAESAQEGHAGRLANDATWAAALAAARDPRNSGRSGAWLAASSASGRKPGAYAAAVDTAVTAARGAVDAEAWDAARTVAWAVVRGRAWTAARTAARDAARDGARDATWDAAGNAAWDATWDAAWGERDAWADAAWAVGDVNGLAAFHHPTTVEWTKFRLPLLDAFEAGLFVYWITPHEVVCVLQPILSIEGGRLHRADGPAAAWPSGESYYFWHGAQVPDWVVEKPHRITVEAIQAESNQEIRRCMTEIYGLSRYLRDAEARLVHQDEFGKLWEAQVGDETWRMVEVENGTSEPDGTRRTYTLDVTDATKVLGWPIETARAAVAATYGLRPEEYHPETRT